LKKGGDKMENQVISILQKMDEKLEHIGKKLDSVEKIVHEQCETLKEHSAILKEHSTILKEHSIILENHSIILKDHSIMLGALKTGQEVVQVEISELRVQNATDFCEIKALLNSYEDSIDLLKEDNWNNRKALLRIQKTIGLS
jgi:hypothetical protein